MNDEPEILRDNQDGIPWVGHSIPLTGDEATLEKLRRLHDEDAEKRKRDLAEDLWP